MQTASMPVEIRHLGPGDERAVFAAGALFDGEPDGPATRRFLTDPGHHLLIAYAAGEEPVGFVSGVEMTHPDKGVEMFLYELGVADHVRRRGIGRSLIAALAALAQDRGCYAMWTAADPGNHAARATYARSGARLSPPHLMVDWDIDPA